MFQFPPSPTVGQTFTPVTGTTYRWNGTAWFLIAHPEGGVTGPIGPAGPPSFIAVTDTAPASMPLGAQWYESDTAGWYMKYVNPDATETLVSIAPVGGDFMPASGGTGRFADGTVAAPGISWASDTDTGWHRTGGNRNYGLDGKIIEQCAADPTVVYWSLFPTVNDTPVQLTLHSNTAGSAGQRQLYLKNAATGNELGESVFGGAVSKSMTFNFGSGIVSNGAWTQNGNLSVFGSITSTGNIYGAQIKLSQQYGIEFTNSNSLQYVAYGKPNGSVQIEIQLKDQPGTWTGVNFNCGAGVFQFWNNGQAWKNDGSTSWMSMSDIRLKKNVAPLEYGLKEILKLEPITFEMARADTTYGVVVQAGISAQNGQQAMPKMVRSVPDEEYGEVLGMGGDYVQYAMVNAIKELTARVAELEAKLEAR